LKLAFEPGVAPEKSKWAGGALRLFYPNIDLSDRRLYHTTREREGFYNTVVGQKKLSLKEAEKLEAEKKLSTADWRQLVQADNRRAENLLFAAKGGNGEAVRELWNYRQCSNCTHVSRIDRTGQGFCHHCDTMTSGSQPMEWLPVVKLVDLPYCLGIFPCRK
jgi:hypothetical protein